MNMHKLLFLAVGCVWAMGASAQWQWIDKDGRKVFSDRAPPIEVPEKNIVQQPKPRPAPAGNMAPLFPPLFPPLDSATGSNGGAPRPIAPAPAPDAGKDKELEERKAQAEAAETAQRKAAEEKNAQIRAGNCQRARQALANLETGRPLMHTDAQGNRVYLDEASRAAELQRIQAVITTDCSR
ncbi:MAG: DUF4124 domain-containing protein [Burkholderiaceae bacterium]|nr:DUF4124 domain-containing protein [Burkholderiaceae bacterium]